MNAKELYLAVGQIDDELILEANEQPAGKRRQVIRRWALAAAACVCLVAGGVCLQLFSTSVIWNAGRAETVSKASIPGYVLLGAAWEQRGTTARLLAEGLEQAELVSVLKELIRR